MSKMALRNSPRFSLLAMIVLITSLALTGCGGGGGSSSGNSGNGGNTGGGGTTAAGTAIVTGQVIDDTNKPVTGATVTIFGTTNLTALTGSNGKFSINNVPVSATTFSVTSPNTSLYYDEIQYAGIYYNTDPTKNPPCQVALPTLTADTSTALPHTVILQSIGNTPPPPPSGCR